MRNFQKNIYFYVIDNDKDFDCGSQQTVENSERDGNTRPPHLPLEKSICRLELDMEQQTCPKMGKVYVKAIYCHLAYVMCMQSTS